MDGDPEPTLLGRSILEPYQLVPPQRIERLPFPRLLIADDTGLGKTAEAGLILSRLLQRRRADRILITCRARPEPERWQEEMKTKFGLDIEVVNDADDYARLRRRVPSHLNVFGAVPRLAMSMFFAAPSEHGTHVVDDLARVRWDVAIVDEAHHLAVLGDPRKRLAEPGRIVSEASEALLLTATPHDGKAESFASLLHLIDPYLVVDPERLDPALVRPRVVRRLKANVTRSDGSRFLRRLRRGRSSRSRRSARSRGPPREGDPRLLQAAPGARGCARPASARAPRDQLPRVVHAQAPGLELMGLPAEPAAASRQARGQGHGRAH